MGLEHSHMVLQLKTIKYQCKTIYNNNTLVMMPFFNQNWARVRMGRWAGPGLMLGCSAGSWIVGAEVGLLQCWSTGSRRGTPLQKQGRRGVGEGFARGVSDA